MIFANSAAPGFSIMERSPAAFTKVRNEWRLQRHGEEENAVLSGGHDLGESFDVIVVPVRSGDYNNLMRSIYP
jgi:hypothetical protein